MIARIKYFIVVLFLILLAFFISMLLQSYSSSSISISNTESTKKEKPTDYELKEGNDPFDLIAYVLYDFEKNSEFRTEKHGAIFANGSGFESINKANNIRIKKDSKLYEEVYNTGDKAISINKYFYENDYKSKMVISSGNMENVTTLSLYKNSFGWTPYELFPFIISNEQDKTVLNINYKKVSKDEYISSFDLDTYKDDYNISSLKKSIQNDNLVSKFIPDDLYEMNIVFKEKALEKYFLELSSTSKIPLNKVECKDDNKDHFLKLKLFIYQYKDEDNKINSLRVLNSIVQDSYSLNLPVLSVSVKSLFFEKFEYDNIEFNKEINDVFQKYEGIKPSGNQNLVSLKPGILGCLSNALGINEGINFNIGNKLFSIKFINENNTNYINIKVENEEFIIEFNDLLKLFNQQNYSNSSEGFSQLKKRVESYLNIDVDSNKKSVCFSLKNEKETELISIILNTINKLINTKINSDINISNSIPKNLQNLVNKLIKDENLITTLFDLLLNLKSIEFKINFALKSDLYTFESLSDSIIIINKDEYNESKIYLRNKAFETNNTNNDSFKSYYELFFGSEKKQIKVNIKENSLINAILKLRALINDNKECNLLENMQKMIGLVAKEDISENRLNINISIKDNKIYINNFYIEFKKRKLDSEITIIDLEELINSINNGIVLNISLSNLKSSSKQPILLDSININNDKNNQKTNLDIGIINNLLDPNSNKLFKLELIKSEHSLLNTIISKEKGVNISDLFTNIYNLRDIIEIKESFSNKSKGSENKKLNIQLGSGYIILNMSEFTLKISEYEEKTNRKEDSVNIICLEVLNTFLKNFNDSFSKLDNKKFVNHKEENGQSFFASVAIAGMKVWDKIKNVVKKPCKKTDNLPLKNATDNVNDISSKNIEITDDLEKYELFKNEIMNIIIQNFYILNKVVNKIYENNKSSSSENLSKNNEYIKLEIMECNERTLSFKISYKLNINININLTICDNGISFQVGNNSILFNFKNENNVSSIDSKNEDFSIDNIQNLNVQKSKKNR